MSAQLRATCFQNHESMEHESRVDRDAEQRIVPIPDPLRKVHFKDDEFTAKLMDTHIVAEERKPEFNRKKSELDDHTNQNEAGNCEE